MVERADLNAESSNFHLVPVNISGVDIAARGNKNLIRALQNHWQNNVDPMLKQALRRRERPSARGSLLVWLQVAADARAVDARRRRVRRAVDAVTVGHRRGAPASLSDITRATCAPTFAPGGKKRHPQIRSGPCACGPCTWSRP